MGKLIKIISCVVFLFSQGRAHNADLIDFSFDRPLQLEAHLRSVYKYITGLNDIIIIYRTSNERFEKAYQQVQEAYPKAKFLKQTFSKNNLNKVTTNFKALVLDAVFTISQCDYILFSVDDIIVCDFVNIQDCINALEQANAYGFYLRMGKNISQDSLCGCWPETLSLPPLKEVKPGIFSWRFCQGTHAWGYPNTVDMTIYRKKSVARPLRQLRYAAPNMLEARWSKHNFWRKTDQGLCFEKSKMINIPLNVVQDAGFDNPSMKKHTPELLLDLFNQGMRLDIDHVVLTCNIVDSHLSPKINFEPHFIKK